MTTPQVPFDAANALLTQGPAELHTGSVNTPAGKAAIVTVRTASTTLTVFLGAGDLRNWVTLLTGLADQLTGGLVTATAADVATVSSPLAAAKVRR